MKPAAASPTQEALAGLVERVTFHNAENGFCVLRTKARGHRDLVTVIGHSAHENRTGLETRCVRRHLGPFIPVSTWSICVGLPVMRL
jgi:hypothetical protein